MAGVRTGIIPKQIFLVLFRRLHPIGHKQGHQGTEILNFLSWSSLRKINSHFSRYNVKPSINKLFTNLRFFRNELKINSKRQRYSPKDNYNSTFKVRIQEAQEESTSCPPDVLKTANVRLYQTSGRLSRRSALERHYSIFANVQQAIAKFLRKCVSWGIR